VDKSGARIDSPPCRRAQRLRTSVGLPFCWSLSSESLQGWWAPRPYLSKVS